MDLRVNIISNNNGVGLTKDYLILKGLIEELGGMCNHVSSLDKRMAQRKIFPEAIDATVNIYLEHYYPVDELKKKAKYNIFFPNPEWFFEKNYVKKFDIILAKTKDAERIFKYLKGNVFFTSFTSEDKRLEIKKVNEFIHAAGKSSMKNTSFIFNSWKTDMPRLFLITQNSKYYSKSNVTCVTERLEDNIFNQMLNKCRFHLCPSQYEGFGHYIWEAMSCENLVISSNHQPMNEFITDNRFLVNGRIGRVQGYGQLFDIDMFDLRKKIKYIQSLSDDEVNFIGKINRQKWEDNDLFFRNTFKKLLEYIK